MENILQVLMIFAGIGGFILVLFGAGLYTGKAVSNASNTDMQGEHYERVSRYNLASILLKAGGWSMFAAFVLAIIVKHAF